MKRLWTMAVIAALLSTPALAGGYIAPNIDAPVIVAETAASSANKDNIIVMMVLALVFASVAR